MLKDMGGEDKRTGLLHKFPKLERDERLELLERVREGAAPDADFVVMMIISTGMASLGLIQGATAVVIGAMLVAPLMGPLVASGLALVQGNADLFRKGIRVTALGIAIGLAAAMAFGLMNPGYEPSLEIEARGKADIMDLGIAYLSGMAAAYALSRPKVAVTLAGVAIAAALVPPLAVVGIALTNQRLWLAGNAAILLLTNLVAIILGAATIFRLMGVNLSLKQSDMPRWAKRATMCLGLAIVLLLTPLLMRMVDTQRTGVLRPATYPVSADVRKALGRFVKGFPSVKLVTAARSSVEPEQGITVVCSSYAELAPSFESDLNKVVHEAHGAKMKVRLFVFRTALAYVAHRDIHGKVPTLPDETPETKPTPEKATPPLRPQP
jgi:uncharacterized hydrophobic protein (TIGR00271 family)